MKNNFTRGEIPQDVFVAIQKTHSIFLQKKMERGLYEMEKPVFDVLTKALKDDVWTFPMIAVLAEFYQGNLEVYEQFKHRKPADPKRLKECETVMAFISERFQVVSSPLGIMLVLKFKQGDDV